MATGGDQQNRTSAGLKTDSAPFPSHYRTLRRNPIVLGRDKQKRAPARPSLARSTRPGQARLTRTSRAAVGCHVRSAYAENWTESRCATLPPAHPHPRKNQQQLTDEQVRMQMGRVANAAKQGVKLRAANAQPMADPTALESAAKSSSRARTPDSAETSRSGTQSAPRSRRPVGVGRRSASSSSRPRHRARSAGARSRGVSRQTNGLAGARRKPANDQSRG